MKKINAPVMILAIGIATMFGATAAMAQEAVTFGDDARYVRVQFVKYHTGKAAEAYGIINNKFSTAAEAAGVPRPVIVHFQTGQFDAAFHWRLENGPADLEWRISPNNAEFMAALAEQEGSMEAAQELFGHYQSLIARTNSAIGHRHVADGEE